MATQVLDITEVITADTGVISVAVEGLFPVTVVRGETGKYYPVASSLSHIFNKLIFGYQRAQCALGTKGIRK